MTDMDKLWSAINQTLMAYAPFYQEGVRKHVRDTGAPNIWFNLNNVRGAEPAPFTEQHVQKLYPYNRTAARMETLDQLAEQGFLLRDDDGYRLTESGRGVVEGFFKVVHEGLGSIEPLPAGQLEELSQLLRRLLDEVLESAPPEAEPWIASSRWTDPGDDAAPSARIDQYVTDIIRYRDYAHIAAWKPYGVSGSAWEALTSVWREQVATAAEMAERNAARGYSADEYAGMLADLEVRGWLKQEEGRYAITAEGRRIREEAEEETNRIYFAAWSNLSEAELDKLQQLLNQANDNLATAGEEQLWTLARDVSSAIFQVTREATAPAIEQHFESPRTFYPVLMAMGQAPEPFTAADFGRRYPYMNPERAEESLQIAAEEGLLSAGEEGRYTVSESGHKAFQSVTDPFYNRLGELEIMPQDDLEQLAGLLDRVVQSSIEAPDPAGNWSVTNSRRSHPQKEYAPLARIDQHLDDLNAFRDDAHISAWRGHGVNGRTWETLSAIWSGQAATAAELVENLALRGYGEDDYARSLSQLFDRGWLKRSNGTYQLTETASALREETEDVTNRYFFGPWACLDENERGQLRLLLIRLKLGLHSLIEEEQPAT